MKDTRKPGGGPRKPGRDGAKPARGGDGPARSGDRPGPGGDRPFRKDGEKKNFGARKAFGGPKKSVAGRPKTDYEKNPAHLEVTGEGERISKIMARAGVASRRDCERMIMDGRVTLNGRVLESPAVNCTPQDRIEVDGQLIGAIERTRLWIYYKPAGLVTTNFDPEGRPTVFDNLPEELPRVISVGRLDINTEGLLLLTNDGGLARMLELPTTGWLRRYRVRAHGAIDQARLDALRDGIAVDGVLYGSIEATLDREQGSNVWITMGLREGKNREIKNVLGALGLDVNRLIRISYGPFQLGELEEGAVVEVKSRTLREQLGPRLIEEANANFEAPIHNQPKPEKEEAEDDWTPKPRRESREERRERDLARIGTKKPERGGFRDRDDRRDRNERSDRRGGKDDKKPKRPPLGTSRTANVWMAPGARPVAPKKAKAKAEDATTGPKRRVLKLRTADEETVEAPARRPRGERPARAERPERSERSESASRPRTRKPHPDSERGERSFEGRRREAGPGDDHSARKARPARSFNDDRASGEDRPKRSFSGKPRGASGDKPRSRPADAQAERSRGGGPRKGPDAGGKPGGGSKGSRGGAGRGPGRGADRRR